MTAWKNWATKIRGLTGDKTFLHSGLQGHHEGHRPYPYGLLVVSETDAAIDELEGGLNRPQHARIPPRAVWRGRRSAIDLLIQDRKRNLWRKTPANSATSILVGSSSLDRIGLGNLEPYGLDHLAAAITSWSGPYHRVVQPGCLRVWDSALMDSRRTNVGICEAGSFNQRLIQADGESRTDNLQLEAATTFWYDELSGGRGQRDFGVSHAYASHGSVDGDNGGTGPDQNETRFRSALLNGVPQLAGSTRVEFAGADSYHLLGLKTSGTLARCSLLASTRIFGSNATQAPVPICSFGGYMQASDFLTGEHMPWDRESARSIGSIPSEDFFLVNRCRGGDRQGTGRQVAARDSHADLNDAAILPVVSVRALRWGLTGIGHRQRVFNSTGFTVPSPTMRSREVYHSPVGTTSWVQYLRRLLMCSHLVRDKIAREKGKV